ETIDEECIILGCGAPQVASVGLVDTMRVSQDVNIFWKPADPANVGGVSTQHAVQNTLLRSPLNQQWWLNDPDCVIVRQSLDLNVMSRSEIRSLASVAALTGSVLLDSDNLARVKPIYLKDLRRILPALAHTAHVRKWFASKDQQPSEFELKHDENHFVLATINWEEYSRSSYVDLPDHELYHVYEFWSKKYLGVHRSRVKIPYQGPHQTIVLQCARVSDEPDIAASPFHIAGVLHENIIRTGHSLQIALSSSSKVRGNILVNMPPRKKITRARINGKRARFKKVGPRVIAISCTLNTDASVEIDFES
ncbi:MAG TPA: hypothetical protein VFD70_17315, partial [Anaerolineae bacterium]|nr:hypothetical protein [Anaerolineae bacterium]